MQSFDFQCDVSGAEKPFPHFWEHTIGSGHATLALRSDWQKQLKRCHEELGFLHVRFHGILSDDMGTLMREDDHLVYSFFNANQVCDFLLSIGMKPFMELSFMPSTLSSGDTTVFHYKTNVTPPRDYNQWQELIQKLVKNWSDRYGVDEVKKWFFEVWNEPNLKAFWTGSRDDYFQLYERTARAVKSIHPEFRVGGPATADNEWISEFVLFCNQRDIPCDFVSTHHYPTDAFGKPGDDTIGQLAASYRSVLCEEATKAKQQAQGKPLYYTEWSTSSNPFDDLHDEPYVAAFITKTIMEAQGIVDGYSYWIFSDIFEENYFSSKPFHGGFGLLNIYGIPKPAYRAYEILHQLGTVLVSTQGKHATVDVWVTKESNEIKVLVTNSALPRHPVKTETVRIQLRGLKAIKSSTISRIDDDHANAPKLWKEMGSHDVLSPAEVEELEKESLLKPEPFSVKIENDFAFLEIEIPVQGTACITLVLE
jgi:xylan 1,4-beta-xylosidase